MSIRSGVDMFRLSKLASRPGVDPRLWLTLATVTDVAFDAEHGMFADVQFMPDGDRETCLIGSDYAGNGFGEWLPLKTGDVVLVAVSHGDPGAGCVLIKRIFTGSALPPSDFKNPNSASAMDARTDPVFRIEDGATLHIIAQAGANISLELAGGGKIALAATGAGTVEITAEGTITVNSPDVRLGDGGAPVARVGDLVVGAINALTTIPGLPIAPLPPAVPTPSGGVMFVGQITSGASKVKA